MILYSEAAAEEFSDLVLDKTLVNVGGIILGSALLSSAVATVMAAGSSFLANTKLIYGTFGSKAAFIYIAEGAGWLGIGYGTSKSVDAIKGGGFDIPYSDGMTANGKNYHIPGVYEVLGVNDDAEGKTIQEIDNITNSNGSHIPKFGDSDPYADAADIYSDHNPRISEYETWEHRQEAGLYTRDLNLTESNPEYTNTRDPRAIRELNPGILEDNPTPTHQADRSGSYVDRVQSRYEVGQQLHSTNLNDIKTKGVATLKNSWPSPLEWVIDFYNIGMNKLLKIPLEDFNDSLKVEAEAKAGITVQKK